MEHYRPSQPSHPHHTQAPLSALKTGAAGVVSHLEGEPEFLNRLLPLGFTLGAQVQMVRNYGDGPMVVSVRGTQIALGRREASQIVVQAL